MSTVKISELAAITVINANTANTLLMGVDIPTGVTGKFTARTLAQGLYLNEVLNVGNNSVVFPNTIAQFSGNSITYLQMNMQNFNSAGSGDFIVTADTGTNANSFVDLGINNSTFSDAAYSSMAPYDGYLYVHGPSDASASGNLILGTAAANANVSFIIGGTTSDNVIAKLTKTALELQRQITFADGTSQNTSSASAGSYANAAFIKANTPPAIANSTASYANAAFLQANTPSYTANSAAAYANGAFVQANAAFLQANTPSYTANSAALYANGAFLQANTPSAIANSAATYANGAFIQANAAYTKANSALANTSGTFDGNLSITGNLSLLAGSLSSSGNMTVNGTMVLANTNFSATEAAITIKATANVSTPSNDGYMLHISGKQNTASRIVFDSYSVTGNAYAVVAGRTARGTVDAPLPVANNDVLMRVSGNGRGNTSWSQFGVARIDIVATEDYTDERRGSQIQFWNCAVGSNTLQEIATFNGDSIHFTGQVNPQKGFIYTPRILQGAQTAITINFSTDSMIRGTFAATVTNSFSNYVPGKIVEMWLTNTAGNGQTVVHGCLANNSTIGATSLSIASGRSVYLKYFSIDGDQANTFVAVTYA